MVHSNKEAEKFISIPTLAEMAQRIGPAWPETVLHVTRACAWLKRPIGAVAAVARSDSNTAGPVDAFQNLRAAVLLIF